MGSDKMSERQVYFDDRNGCRLNPLDVQVSIDKWLEVTFYPTHAHSILDCLIYIH